MRGEWLGSGAFASSVLMAIGAIVHGSFWIAIAAIADSEVPSGEMLRMWKVDRITDILGWGVVALVATMCINDFAVAYFQSCSKQSGETSPNPVDGVG